MGFTLEEVLWDEGVLRRDLVAHTTSQLTIRQAGCPAFAMVSLVENESLSDSPGLHRSSQSYDLSVFCFHFAAARHLATFIHANIQKCAITQNAKFFESNG